MIKTPDIGDKQVTERKLADGSVTSSKLSTEIANMLSLLTTRISAFKVADNLSSLPTEENTIGWLVDNHLYVYVGNGSTPESGMYQDCGELRGPQGIQGEQGLSGLNGKSAYDIWTEQPGNEDKSEIDFLEFTRGSKGDKGDQGERGYDISNIEQIVKSTEDGGKNIIRVTRSDGWSKVFEILNGSKGSKGDKGTSIVKLEQTRKTTESSGLNTIEATLGDGTKESFEIYNGAKGEQGDKGEKGDKGDQGEIGPQGNSGIADASNKTLVNDAITGGETNFLSAEVGKLGILTYDCSKGGTVTHTTLQDAINSVPTTFQKVGLTITYKSGNTIYRYILKANAWSADPVNWFSVEDKLSDLSGNLEFLNDSLKKNIAKINYDKKEKGYITPNGFEETTATWVSRYTYNIRKNSIYTINTDVNNDSVAVALVKDDSGKTILISQASSESRQYTLSTIDYPSASTLIVSGMSAPTVTEKALERFSDITDSIEKYSEKLSGINSSLGNLIDKVSEKVDSESVEEGYYYTPNAFKAEASWFNIAYFDIEDIDGDFTATTDTDNSIVAVAVLFSRNGEFVGASENASVSKTWSFSKKDYPSAKTVCISYLSSCILSCVRYDRIASLENNVSNTNANIDAIKTNLSYVIQNNLKGKIIAWFGTSIPAGWENGQGYPNKMGQLLGATVYNEAKGGSCANGKLDKNYTMDLYVLSLSLGHTIKQKLQILDSCYVIDDVNKSVSMANNTLGITGIPENVTYEQAIETRWSLISMSYELKLIVRHLIKDNNTRKVFLVNRLGTALYEQIISEGRDIEYTGGDIFVFDHGNNDFAAGSYPYNSDDITVFPGAINTYIKTIYKWKPKAKIVLISNYIDRPANVNKVIQQIATAWGCNYINVEELLPFKIFKKVSTQGFWDNKKIWHDTGFTWSESDGTYNTNLYLDGMDSRVRGDLSLSEVKDNINPHTEDGILYWDANPVDIWLYDGLHPHQNGDEKTLWWYAKTLALQFINNVNLY